MRVSGFIILTVALLFLAQCSGAKVCGKKLKGKLGDIIVASKPCILDNVTVKTITIRKDGNLTVTGISEIETIKAGDGAIITLKNKTKVDEVIPGKKASIELLAIEKSFVGVLSLIEAGKTRAEGAFGFVTSMKSATLKLISSTVNKDLTVTGGGGDLRICGTTVSRKTLITSRSGKVSLGNFKSDCAGSRFQKSVNIKGGGGFLTIDGSAASYVGIRSRKGSVSLTSSSFGKFLVAEVKGDVNLTTSSTKGGDIENVDGDLTIMGTSFSGPLQISEKTKREVGLTTIKESSFPESKEDTRLTVKNRGQVSMTSTNLFKGIATMTQVGPVEFKGNGDVKIGFYQVKGLRVIENNILFLSVRSSKGGILLEKSVIGQGKVDMNSGKITIFQCVFSRLSCSKNDPAPIGKENAISKSATGQCAKFK